MPATTNDNRAHVVSELIESQLDGAVLGEDQRQVVRWTIDVIFEDEVDRMAEKLAKDVLVLAAIGGMPDTYWLADRRIVRACFVLGWTHEQARDWAREQTP